MTKFDLAAGYSDGDIDTNLSGNPSLQQIVDARYSRRQTLFGGASAVAVAALGGSLLTACGGSESPLEVTAGNSGQSSSGKIVALSATAAGEGTLEQAMWEQVSGPAVTLTAVNPLTATFISPSVTTDQTLGFRFSGQRDGTKLGTANTSVTVSPARLDFVAVPKNLNDIVTVPAGYTVNVLYRLGDPINSTTPAFANDGTDTGFSARAGDHHDGMSYFGLGTDASPNPASNSRGLLVLNHENITQRYLHPNGPTTVAGARPEGEALKEMECHGVSVIEVTSSANAWTYVQASPLNRRITPLTPVTISGPAAGNAQLRTLFSPTAVAGRGTINNCANGYTPWHTYLTNEENWAGYFRRDAGDVAARGGATAKVNISLARYGIREGNAGNYGWSTVTPTDEASTVYSRWNGTARAGTAADGSGDFRNEPFQFGWVVEIDPYNATSTPRKRTALGRMNHEGCWPGRFVAGVRPAFYMGDDAQNEYLYKFVSSTPWAATDSATTVDRLAMGDKYLNTGTLYVARFDADGTGAWLPLTFGTGPLVATNTTYPFADQADVLINTRLAADVLGATRMDRPEWTAVNPATGEMYLTLTNNSSRTAPTADAANPRFYNDPKGAAAQRGNPNGHILRLKETGDTTEATTFRWDIYAFGAGSDLDSTNINLSGLDTTNDFSSPDGLWFGRSSYASGLVTPLLWIQTDDGAFTDVTNNQMLVGMPGTVGDGAARTVTNEGGTTRGTFVGKAPAGQLRRFLVGPKECEITGIDSSPDGRAVFVNIQHPGENGSPAAISSNWPANQNGTAAPTARPRSATIVITKNDGGVVGL